MPRGVVLWPDRETASTIERIWGELARVGLESLSVSSHRMHRPHCSILVAEDVDVRGAVTSLAPGEVALTLAAESVGWFPQGVLFLSVTPTRELLAMQARLHATVLPFASTPWDYYRPDRWTPHVTLAVDCASDRLAHAMSIVGDFLPLSGSLTSVGVEDGDTGERWQVRPDA